jgi:hypothetical protein
MSVCAVVLTNAIIVTNLEWHGKTEATSLSLSVRDQSPTALAIGEVAPGDRLAVADSLLDRTEVVS